MAVHDEPPKITPPGKGWHWTPQTGSNPARYLVDPGSRSDAGNLRHIRPYLVSGEDIFVWPVGAEGFRRTGRATVGLHHFIGDNAVDVHVIHRDESRIELSGIFPGNRSVENMIALRGVLMAETPAKGKVLHMPGIFGAVQYVVNEDYDFGHEEDDWTHSISYRVSFIVIGTGAAQPDPHGDPPPENPGESGNSRGVAARFFVVKDGLRSFKAIATRVYNDVSMWPKLVDMNQTLLREFREQRNIFIPSHQLPTYRWPIGTRVKY